MRSFDEVIDLLKQYTGAHWIINETGYIVWQLSTGENVEILWIAVNSPGKGHATELVRQMCERIKPFNSVFVFRKASNETAGHFYRSLGFRETLIQGLYKEDAVLGVVNYERLCQSLSTKKSSGKSE